MVDSCDESLAWVIINSQGLSSKVKGYRFPNFKSVKSFHSSVIIAKKGKQNVFDHIQMQKTVCVAGYSIVKGYQLDSQELSIQ